MLRSHIDAQTLYRARLIAAGWQVPVNAALLALGWVQVGDYLNTLARVLGVSSCLQPRRLPAGASPTPVWRIDATTPPPSRVADQVNAARDAGYDVELTTPLIPDLIDRHQRRAAVFKATRKLRDTQPKLSAGTAPPLWPATVAGGAAGLCIGAAMVDTSLAYFAMVAVAAVTFALIVCQRLLALATVVLRPGPAIELPDHRSAMAELPIYTVLVPLYEEADILPDLLDALIRLDYPAAKLDIILALETTDVATRAAARRADLPGFIRVVTVPPFGPRTKPKALNYAMSFARGAYVTIFDAEDVPEPGQLRQALDVFQRHPDIVCLQARLNIYNRQDGWLARQFALEYTALFDGLLPALERLNVPLPLGGTSNHFRREALERADLWDPFNVTEDADLGIRLARRSGRIGVLASTTWEEAPASLATWLPQRTRWLKGWMQTYMVHMREPTVLWRELGAWRFINFQLLIVGLVLSAFAHPLLCAMVAIELASPTPFANAGSQLQRIFWCIALFDLAAGYLSAIIMVVVTTLRRRWPGLALSIVWMPIYWLLSSLAAYRALWQLFVAPHRWEKTRHKPRRGVMPMPYGPY